MDNNTTNNNAVDLKSLNIAGNTTNTTNSTATENTTSVNPSAEDPNSKEYKESLANDSIALAYDYYDRYYENVLSKLDTIVVSEDTSIKNQEQIISKLDTVTLTFNTILFAILLWFLIDIIRHMWKK